MEERFSGTHMNLQVEWDLIVVGAGAAGMMAAFRSASLGRRTLLLEKNTKAGVKILMSGGTRCNVTHDTDIRGILEAFGEQGRFLRPALHALSPADVVAFFESSGVATKVEDTGKVFPASDRALDVQRALLRRMESVGVALRLGQAVCDVRRGEQYWEVDTPGQTWRGSRLLVTTGGCSYPGCGTTGDAYPWMERLGHNIVTPRPALVPLTSPASWVQDLSGLTLEDALVRVVPRETVAQVSRIGDLNQRLALVRKQQRAERRSSLLLTHFGLSGPAAMDVSRRVTDCGRADEVQLVCDLLPEWTVERLQSELSQQVERQGQRSIGRWLSEALPVPQRLVGSLLQQISVDPQQRIAELSKASRLELLAHLKSLVVPVSGSRGFTKAEVTAGGVSLSDVDSKTMASRRAEGLYLAGEVLDIDGPIGGYNFQAAFSTGWLAADSASQ